MRSEAAGHVAAPDHPKQRGEVQIHGTHGSVGAYLSREAWFGATGHVVVCGCTPYLLSRLEACMRGYLICMVPMVAPGPLWGRLRAYRLGQLFSAPPDYFECFAWQLKW
jgi:hypothetical protein